MSIKNNAFSYIVSYVCDNNNSNEAKRVLDRIKTTSYKHITQKERQLLDDIKVFHKKNNQFPTREELKNIHDDYVLFLQDEKKVRSLSLSNLEDNFYKYIEDKILSSLSVEIQDRTKTLDIDDIRKRIESIPKKPTQRVQTDLRVLLSENKKMFEGLDTESSFETGIGDLKIIDGFLTGIFAVTNVGKSNVTTNLATKRYTQGYKVLLLTYEESKQSMLQRISATLAEFNKNWFFLNTRKQELMSKIPKVETAIDYYNNLGGKIVVENGSDYNIESVHQLLKDEYDNTGIGFDLIVADGFYLAGANNLEGWAAKEHNIKYLNKICTGTGDLPPMKVIFTSQLDLKSTTQVPSMKDINKSQEFASTPSEIIALVKTKETDSYEAHRLKSRIFSVGDKWQYKMDWSKNRLLWLDDTNQQSIDIFKGVKTSLQLNDLLVDGNTPKIYPNNNKQQYLNASKEKQKLWIDLLYKVNSEEITIAEANDRYDKTV